MSRTSMIAATTAAASAASGPAPARQRQHATAAEARAMLDRGVAAVRADETEASKGFDTGTKGFRDRDLYPLCVAVQAGIYTAHLALWGKQALDPNGDSGHAYDEAILCGGSTEGTVDEVVYPFPRPSGGGAVPKATEATYVTEIDDQIRGVGCHR